jgi:hypothetical protein
VETRKGQLYIGHRSETHEPVLLKAATLTTHGVIVGMTGSGKTGLGVDIIEEALLNDIPTLVIDPKGDMGNIILNFPDNNPSDLEPWMDQAKAKRKGVSVADLAISEAEKRRANLAEHEITPELMRRLKEHTEVTIYTPGSSAGVSLNVLGSLNASKLDWATQAEFIRDEIEAFVSSLLVLAGVDSNPVSGPEHILVSTIIETWWKQGKDLDLATLIGQIPKPPFRKLGVFELDTFLPEKERMALALQLNSLLASPSFATWLEGEPLDIETLIGASDKTKCAVIYLAHLTDQERQFIVTLLLSKLVTWIRSQSGQSDLRTLVYLDEAVGYAPPTAEPPSKKPIMTILKQARAFGVGLILVTQNPMDLDYKAMSNAGTWIVGRLQTENDKKRIIEGMQSVSESTETPSLDNAISNLSKRQFILHVAKKSGRVLFRRRRSISYRYGPMTREQVKSLMADRRTQSPTTQQVDSLLAMEDVDDSSVEVAPAVADGIEVVYLDPATPWAPELGADPTGKRYAAAAAVTVQLLYDEAKAGFSHSEVYEAIIYPLDGLIDLTDVKTVDHDARDFSAEPAAGTSYELVNIKIQNKTFWKGLNSDLKTHLVANRRAELLHNPDLKMYSREGENPAAFRSRCERAANDSADDAMAKLRDKYATRINRVKDHISTADLRVRELEGDASARTQDELMSGAGDLLGALLGGRKSSNPLGKAASRRAATQKAQTRADTAASKLDAEQQKLAELEDELSIELAEIAREHKGFIDSIETVSIPLEKVDIRVADTKLVWVPIA